MRLSRDLVDTALGNAGLDVEAVNVRGDYSGRGMLGRTCFGVDFDSLGDSFAFIAALVAEMERTGLDVFELLRTTSTDDMGRGMILYFPGVTLDGDTDTEVA